MCRMKAHNLIRDDFSFPPPFSSFLSTILHSGRKSWIPPILRTRLQLRCSGDCTRGKSHSSHFSHFSVWEMQVASVWVMERGASHAERSSQPEQMDYRWWEWNTKSQRSNLRGLWKSFKRVRRHQPTQGFGINDGKEKTWGGEPTNQAKLKRSALVNSLSNWT